MDFQKGELVRVKSKKIPSDVTLSVEGLYYKDGDKGIYFCRSMSDKGMYTFSEKQMKRVVRDDRKDE